VAACDEVEVVDPRHPLYGRRYRLISIGKETTTRGACKELFAGNLTVTQLATRLGIPATWVYVQLRRGNIVTTRESSGRFLFPDKKSALEAIRNLRNHRVAKINLREDHHEK
jgi:hypothetical protein